MKDVRFGYAFWGFLGDEKFEYTTRPGREGDPIRKVSSPDGNATYSWAILHEAQRRGWKTFHMMPDRDTPNYHENGLGGMFDAFSEKSRRDAYMRTPQGWYGPGPVNSDLDVLLLEWRWPIPGRNCHVADDANYQPDLDIQLQLLEHYKEKGTKVILFDLDHKLTAVDELHWMPDAIFETAVRPRRQAVERTRVEIPFVIDDLLQFPTVEADPQKLLAYVGSRYERDEVIDRYVGPVAREREGQVHFYGNWSKTLDDCLARWPGIVFHDRVTVTDFRGIYQDAAVVPLLAKQSYFERGFVTARIWESLLFGSIPVGFSAHVGIDQYLPLHLIADDADDLQAIAEYVSQADVEMRDTERQELVEQLEFMDARHFVDRIEEVVDGRNTRKMVPQGEQDV